MRDDHGVPLEFAGFVLDEKRCSLTGPSGPVHLEPQVFDVLSFLAANRDRVVTKQELFDSIWGGRFVSESALTSRIKAARRAVGDDGQVQQVIKTVHGRGYQFVADVNDGGGTRGTPLPRLRNEPIGRDADIGSVIDRLRSAALVTITGSGGIGKTTVALALAHRAGSNYRDGVVFVDLSPVSPDTDITRAVADAAGVEGAASETLARLADYFADRPVLLVLDNCEHVIAQAAELVGRVLDRGEGARVLATSREPLGIGGEHVWPLGPLDDHAPALFVERARAAEPRMDWDPAHAAVREVCRRLDGVPLAIELAAGQLRRFDIEELNRRLHDRLAVRASGAYGNGHRHSTMGAAIDWSYRLLDGDEQRLLRYLCVFPATFDVHAVEACAPKVADAVAVLGELVDKSLVVRVPGTGRYRLLETVRLFARERLNETAETDGTFERYRVYVRDSVTSTSRLDRWMSAHLGASVRGNLEDARQAFRLSMAHDQLHDAIEIAIAFSFLWRNAIGDAEGATWIEELLRRDLRPEDAIWAHILRSDVGQGRGDHRSMFDAAANALDLVPRIDDPVAHCVAAHYAALAHLTSGDARRHLDAALDPAHASGDRRLVALIESFTAVGDVIAERYDAARSTVAHVHATVSEDGYDRFILHWTGWLLALAERDAAAARRWIDLQYQFLDRTGIVETWLTSFSTAMCDGIDGADVHGTLSRTLALADREGYRADADCLLVLAYAEIGAGRPEAAAELVGTAVHSRFNATAHYVLYQAALVPLLRRELGEDRMREAMARGRARSAPEALAAHGVARPH